MGLLKRGVLIFLICGLFVVTTLSMTASAETATESNVYIGEWAAYSITLEVRGETLIEWDWQAESADDVGSPDQGFSIKSNSGVTVVTVNAKTSDVGSIFVTEEDGYTFTWATEMAVYLDYTITFLLPVGSTTVCCTVLGVGLVLLAVASMAVVVLKKE